MVSSLKKRFVAFLVDYILIYLFIVVLFYKVKLPISDIFILMIGASFFSLFYFTFFLYKFYGQTPGYYLLRIRVISLKNRPIKFKEILLRAASLFPFFCPWGPMILILLALILISIKFLKITPYKEKKQLVWDVGSNTYVVDVYKPIKTI